MADVTMATDDPAARSARRTWRIQRAAIYGLLILFTAIYVLPLAVVIMNTFRPLEEIGEYGLINFPRSLQFSAWGIAWSEYCINGVCEGMRQNFLNSLYMAIPATIILNRAGFAGGWLV